MLGSFSSGSAGNVANVTATAGAAFSAPAAAETVKIRILGAGLNGSAANDLSLAIATTDTIGSAVANINTAIAADAPLAATGIQAVNYSGKIQFVGHAGQSFEVLTAGDAGNALGFGTYLDSTGTAASGGNFDYSSITASAASAAKTQGVQVSLNGGATIDLGTLTGSALQ